jgi:hypothetical protein
LSATTNCRESVAEIHFRYQSVIKGALVAVKVAVNLSAFTMLVICSLLRYAALPSKQIRSGDAESANRGTGFLAAEMKEYDA